MRGKLWRRARPYWISAIDEGARLMRRPDSPNPLMRGKSEPMDLVIADEQPQFSEDIRRLHERAFGVIAHARDGRAAGALVRELRPRVVVLDPALPRRGELEAAIEGSPGAHPIGVLAIVAAMGQAQLCEAIRLGAHGVTLRSAGAADAVVSIREVAAGRYWFPSDGLAILIEVLQDYIRKKPAPLLQEYALTPRELAIISKIMAGFSNRMVGMEFSISERTVKHHLTNIYNKIGVSNRLELAMFAIQRQLAPVSNGDAGMANDRD
jgi:two-component system nitrate/nitrite response regulator NarL